MKKYVCIRFLAVGGAVVFICCMSDIRVSLKLTLVQFDAINSHITVMHLCCPLCLEYTLC